MSRTTEVLDTFAMLGLDESASPAPFAMAYVRDLSPEDFLTLDNVPLDGKASPVRAMRYAHHMLARLLASGKRPQEAAAITGHSVQRVYDLQTRDPAFIELLAHYKASVDQQFMDATGRLAVLGLTVTEELQERVEEDPKKFTNRELREIAEMAFDRSAAPKKSQGSGAGNGAAGSGVTVNVSFVTPQSAEAPPTIEVTATPQLEGPDK